MVVFLEAFLCVYQNRHTLKAPAEGVDLWHSAQVSGVWRPNPLDSVCSNKPRSFESGTCVESTGVCLFVEGALFG